MHVERGLLHTLRLGRQRPVANTDSYICADMPAGFPRSALQGEPHVSVMSIASTINVATRRNTVSAIKTRAGNDPWAAVNPALPIVSVAEPKVESR